MDKPNGSLTAGAVAWLVLSWSEAARAGDDRKTEEPPAEPSAPLEVLAAPRTAAPVPPDKAPSVRPDHVAPSGVSISADAASAVPGALGDPARAVEALPGRSWLVSGIPFAFVRGEPPDNTAYYLDGIRLPMVFHFGVGPGVFPASLVDHVDYYPGAPPAHFGRAAGGAVVFEPARDPSRAGVEASARLFDLGAEAHAPFADARGSALVGARYAYSAAIASLLSNQYVGWYGGYHARISYDVSSSDRVGIFALGAYGDADEKTPAGTEPRVGAAFHRVDVRYDKRFGDSARVRVAAQLGYDHGSSEERSSTDTSKAFRLEVAHRLADGLELWWGGDVQLDSYSAERPLGSSDENWGAVLVSRDDRTMGAYASASYQRPEAFEANAGVRADAYHSLDADELAVSPQGSVRVHLVKGLRAVGSGAIAHQPPSVLFPFPAARVAGLEGGLQKTIQTSAGIEADMSSHWCGSLVGFRSWHRRTSDFLGTLTTPFWIPEVQTRADGETTGAELTLSGKPAPEVGVFLAYTLSRAVRRLPGRSFVSSFDRTHVLTAIASYDLGRGWQVGVRNSVVSGVPRNDPATAGTDAEHDRVPVFARLDGRAEKRWNVSGRYPVRAWFEVMNMFLTPEVVLSDCEEAGCLSTDRIGPITVPNVGAEISF